MRIACSQSDYVAERGGWRDSAITRETPSDDRSVAAQGKTMEITSRNGENICQVRWRGGLLKHVVTPTSHRAWQLEDGEQRGGHRSPVGVADA